MRTPLVVAVVLASLGAGCMDAEPSPAEAVAFNVGARLVDVTPEGSRLAFHIDLAENLTNHRTQWRLMVNSDELVASGDTANDTVDAPFGLVWLGARVLDGESRVVGRAALPFAYGVGGQTSTLTCDDIVTAEPPLGLCPPATFLVPAGTARVLVRASPTTDAGGADGTATLRDADGKTVATAAYDDARGMFEIVANPTPDQAAGMWSLTWNPDRAFNGSFETGWNLMTATGEVSAMPSSLDAWLTLYAGLQSSQA